MKLLVTSLRLIVISFSFIYFVVFVAYADDSEYSIKHLEIPIQKENKVEKQNNVNKEVFYGTVCIEGYKFAFARVNGNYTTIQQMYYTFARTLPPQPIKCKMDQ